MKRARETCDAADGPVGAYNFLQQVPLLKAQLLENLMQATQIDVGEQALMLGMRKYRSHVVVQQAGCMALRELAADKDWVDVIMGLGIRDVVEAMTAHLGDSLMQKIGSKVIWLFAKGDGGNVEGIVDEGGINLVLTSMTAHVGTCRVQMNGCGILSVLAGDQDVAVAIVAAGGIGRVLTAMTAHAQDIGVQHHGCKALSGLLAVTDDETMTKIEAARVIRVVLSAMKEHEGNTRGTPSMKVQQYGCMVLFNIGISDLTLLKRIKDEEGVGVVEAAIKAMDSSRTRFAKSLGQILLGELGSKALNPKTPETVV